MSANDSKRYYWLKLKKDFFQQHQIKVLKALPNGRLYALIYLELLAESTTHNGELRYSKMLPYDITTLASVIDEDKDNVENAIKTFIKLEIAEIFDDGTIYMREIQKLIGSETGQTIRKKEAKMIAEGNSRVNFTLDIRDKSTDNREKEIYKEKPDRKGYGTYKNVFLTDEQYEQLKQEFPNYQDWIERVSEYCASKGKKYKDYLATIRSWARKETKDELPTYNESKNKKMSQEEEDELLELMGKKRYDPSNNPKIPEEKKREILERMNQLREQS